MKNILFCCFALLACMVNGQISQQQINKWNADFYNTYDQDLEKAFLLAKKALKESKKIDYIAGEGGALYRIGIYYDIKMKSDSARIFLFTSKYVKLISFSQNLNFLIPHFLKLQTATGQVVIINFLEPSIKLVFNNRFDRCR